MGSPSSSDVPDVTAEEAWRRLGQDNTSVLIDVRSQAEWAFVGVPNLQSLRKQPLLVEWQTFPDNKTDPEFVERAQAKLAEVGATRESALFFLCRSGARSKLAARAVKAAGFTECLNISDGFEGPLDEERHRGRLRGWKVAGLPWVQG